jgi:hypothetical protein
MDYLCGYEWNLSNVFLSNLQPNVNDMSRQGISCKSDAPTNRDESFIEVIITKWLQFYKLLNI